MREIWLQRHGSKEPIGPGLWQPKAPLSSDGVMDLEWMRRHFLDGQKFDLLLASPLVRAQETMRISAGPEGEWQTRRELALIMPEGLDFAVSKMSPSPSSLQQIDAEYPGVVKIEMLWIVQGILKILDELEEGGQALLVSHQPLADLARFHFRKDIGWCEENLATSEIYRFDFINLQGEHAREHHCVGFCHYRLPEPIRKMA